MYKRILLVLSLIIAVFLVASIVPTYTGFSGSAAYAQGPFGKKQSGNTDKQAEQDKKEKEKKESEKKADERNRLKNAIISQKPNPSEIQALPGNRIQVKALSLPEIRQR